ncbi:unnamed protein product [Ilex paraguariensis]|uniref:Uncharacterized protein n=1 Tax=Ilex paraguariensis TaxID=185542 RepID=A0ABC8TN63_9AQUA
MLSVIVTTPKPFSFYTPFLPHHPLPPSLHSPSAHRPPLPKPISAIITPQNPSPQQQQQQLFQPFKPPPSPLPSKFRSLDTNARIEILANRLGVWYEYAPLIPSLTQEGFSLPTIEELTGISGVEQNRLIVATQVRDSLCQSKLDPEILAFFDIGGAELLYEIRLLSATQRAAAASYLVENKLDAKGAQEVARAMKDFPRRRGDQGWDSFDYTLPGDCLSFVYYRQALEHQNSIEMRKTGLDKALEVGASENAKKRVLKELEGKNGEGGEGKVGVEARVRVPVVRMQVGEVAEATVVAVFPVCRAEEREREVEEAPWECAQEGEFGMVVADKGWRRWVVLPGWEPVAGLRRGGVVVAFKDARVLPWRVNRWYKEEAILVVADRGRKEVVADDGFYLVIGGGNGGDDGLKVEKGLALKEMGVKECLGTVVLVVRPPKEETDNQLSDEDWE